MRALMTSILGLTVLPLGAKELTFELQSHPTAVALQFDVSPTEPGSVTLTGPALLVDSPHVIHSNLVASGATRYLVYSTSGNPISAKGKVRVTFQNEGQLTNGMLSVTRIIASDRQGQMVESAPNALPVPSEPVPLELSGKVGLRSFLTASVADLDGAIASIEFRIGGISRGIVGAAPFRLGWTPDTEGEIPFAIEARDTAGGVVQLELGNVHVGPRGDAEEGSFEAFGYHYYGEDAEPSWYSINADPLQSGVSNGIAYLLGIDPYQPNLGLLPQTMLEVTEGESYFTLKFFRLSEIDGIQWSVRQSTTLRPAWSTVPSAQMTEQEVENGFTEVLIRIPVGEADPSELFLQLQVTP